MRSTGWILALSLSVSLVAGSSQGAQPSRPARTQAGRALRWTAAGLVASGIAAGAVHHAMSGHYVAEAQGRVTGPGIAAEVVLEGHVRPFDEDNNRLTIRHDDGRVEHVELGGKDRNHVSGVTLSNGGKTVQWVYGGTGWSGNQVDAMVAHRAPDGTWSPPKKVGRVTITGNLPAINTAGDFGAFTR